MRAADKLKELQYNILYRKIFLNFLIKEKSKWDRYYHAAHLIIATISPILLGIAQIYDDATSNTTINLTKNMNVVGIILSSVVAAMIELKSRLNLDKKVGIAKDQNIKYKDLYEKITTALMRQSSTEAELLATYMVCSEKFDMLGSFDPETDYDLENAFRAYCEKEKIDYLDDVSRLKNMDKKVAVKVEKKEEYKIQIPIAKVEQKKDFNLSEDIEWTRRRLNSEAD